VVSDAPVSRIREGVGVMIVRSCAGQKKRNLGSAELQHALRHHLQVCESPFLRVLDMSINFVDARTCSIEARRISGAFDAASCRYLLVKRHQCRVMVRKSSKTTPQSVMPRRVKLSLLLTAKNCGVSSITWTLAGSIRKLFLAVENCFLVHCSTAQIYTCTQRHRLDTT
jgi:hypothetical protein